MHYHHHTPQVLRKATIVTIVDDDDGGVVMFELPTWEAGAQDSFAQVVVLRRHGADGNVSIDYATKDGTALVRACVCACVRACVRVYKEETLRRKREREEEREKKGEKKGEEITERREMTLHPYYPSAPHPLQGGKHFAETKGRLEFLTGDVRKIIQVPLLPVSEISSMTAPAFRVLLTNPMGGVVLGARKECRVVMVKGTRSLEAIDDGEFNLWLAWQEQFKEAVLPGYNDDEDDLWASIILHYISITFKTIAAGIPPAEWKDGYPCFVIALLVRMCA
jgi:solute carrier family 8 (sodium/calcium exchanger)